MTLITDFIAELYRAANEIDRLTTVEKRRLLERAAHTIVDMEEQLGNVADQRSHRLAAELLKLTDMALDGVPDVLIGHGFLEAADAIRRLKILADSQ
ncbi:hypothetical protein [Neorhizobium sp. P12A]|uniref:hypothetical protein n=1 Tax=Neorhizobium sp. P12A TaxID=2268027 RepID=UPI00165DA99F|nr:hypothetical protein [Neorhizobium sp. P12A]